MLSPLEWNLDNARATAIGKRNCWLLHSELHDEFDNASAKYTYHGNCYRHYDEYTGFFLSCDVERHEDIDNKNGKRDYSEPVEHQKILEINVPGLLEEIRTHLTCPKCGSKLPLNAKFCGLCGIELDIRDR